MLHTNLIRIGQGETGQNVCSRSDTETDDGLQVKVCHHKQHLRGQLVERRIDIAVGGKTRFTMSSTRLAAHGGIRNSLFRERWGSVLLAGCVHVIHAEVIQQRAHRMKVEESGKDKSIAPYSFPVSTHSLYLSALMPSVRGAMWRWGIVGSVLVFLLACMCVYVLVDPILSREYSWVYVAVYMFSNSSANSEYTF